MPAYQSPADQYYALRAQGLSDADIIAQYGLDSPVGRIIALQNRYNAATPNAQGYRYQYPAAPTPAPTTAPAVPARGYAQSGAPSLMADQSPVTVSQQAIAAPAPDAYYQPAPQPQASTIPSPDAFSGPGVVRGPISNEYHYPIEQEVRGPISNEYHYPIEQEYVYPAENVWRGAITPPTYQSDPGVAAGYQPNAEALAAVTGAQDYITRLRNAIAGGLSFDRSAAYVPDTSMLPDSAVAPEYPDANLGAAADYLGGAVMSGLQSYGAPTAYAPTPEVVDMVRSTQMPQPNNPQHGWWGTVMDVLGAPRNALYNWLNS